MALDFIRIKIVQLFLIYGFLLELKAGNLLVIGKKIKMYTFVKLLMDI